MKIQKPMRFFFFIVFIADVIPLQSQEVYNQNKHKATGLDWLVQPISQTAAILKSEDNRNIVLYNGLVKRTFRLQPNLACIDYTNLSNGRQLLRAVREEAKIVVDGETFHIGGLYGQPQKAYLLPEWIDALVPNERDFRFASYEISDVHPQLSEFKSRFAKQAPKPLPGKKVTFIFGSSLPKLQGLKVSVIYEIYNGLPLIVKSVSIDNKSDHSFKINRVVNEVLALVEEQSSVEGDFSMLRKPAGIYFETNYAFNNSMNYAASDQTTHWLPDSSYTTQVHYRYQTPCLMEVYPENAPGIELKPGETFVSPRTYELLQNGDDRESRGLSIRKMYRAIAPWTLANPIFMHLVSKTDDEVRSAIDQCAATGFEALILSFGSHLDMEDNSSGNLQKWKSIADYAHRLGVRIGCYTLFSSRRISDNDDVIDPGTGKPGGAFFGGHAPCFGSIWGLQYRNKIKEFFTQTGFDIWENDGPYPGDLCASTTHPGHKGLDDSQWRQMEIQKELYHWLNERGIYINAPDWYFLDGTNKIALGYRESNFQLPRAQQRILNRQNIFDGTWEKTPSMSWGFVPLTEYGGGGPEATIEPLSQHLEDYEQLMMQYFGAGIQACYRGPRLYDTEETKQKVISVVNWYKKYFDILNSDIIHLRRADGQEWDGWMHANSSLGIRGMVMLFNPTHKKITRTIKIPLYYTGLSRRVKVSDINGRVSTYRVNRSFSIDVKVSIDSESYMWLAIEKG